MTKTKAVNAQAVCDAGAESYNPPLDVMDDLRKALAARAALIDAGRKMLNAPYPGDYKDNSQDANDYRIARIHMRALLLSLGELI